MWFLDWADDWMNTVLAALSLAGVAVAAAAVIVSNRRTSDALRAARRQYEIARIDVVADRASDMMLAVAEFRGALEPYWAVPNDAKAPLPGGLTHFEANTKLEIIFTNLERLRMALVTLPQRDQHYGRRSPASTGVDNRVSDPLLPLRDIHSANIDLAALWMQAAAKVYYWSLVDDDKRQLWRNGDASALVLAAIEFEFDRADLAPEMVGAARDIAKSKSEGNEGPNVADRLLRRALFQFGVQVHRASEAYERVG
jgi:hypothetical protein